MADFSYDVSNQVFDAQVARRMTDSARSEGDEYLKPETVEVLKQIELAAQNGESNVTIYCVARVIQERLAQRGFTVDVSQSSRGFNSFMRVSW